VKLWFWIALKTLQSSQKRTGLASWFSFIGLILGVASMMVAMAVISGFETTLKNAIIDVRGHLIVFKQGRSLDDPSQFQAKLKKIVPDITATIPFVMVEAVAAHQGRLQGVIIQGIDADAASKHLGISKRIVEGKFDFSKVEDSMGVVVGKGFANNFNLKVGDTFRMVLPIANDLNPVDFKRRMGKFKISGIVDLGKHQYNERYLIADLKQAQDFAMLGGRYLGLMVKVKDDEKARALGIALSAELGSKYWVQDWEDDNLFEAVKIEKPILFVVLLIIVIVAALNISSTLFINVVQRYSDIGVLKAMGATKSWIRKIFISQGLIIGFVGNLLGVLLGLLFCWIFVLLQKNLGVIDGRVYHVDEIALQIRFWDIFSIFFFTMLICFLSTLAPAWRGARLKPVEGLRYE
jgi:lipoprotein-releasing system permease protein